MCEKLTSGGRRQLQSPAMEDRQRPWLTQAVFHSRSHMLPFTGPLVTQALVDRSTGRAGSTTESAIAWYARWVYDIEYTQEEAQIAKVNLDYHHVQLADANRTIADPTAEGGGGGTTGVTVQKETYR